MNAGRLRLASALASWMVLLLGTMSLSVTGQLHPVATVLALAGTLLAYLEPGRLRISTAVWNLVGLAALTLALAAWRVGGAHPLTVLAHLTVFFQLYRLLARRTVSGMQICYLIAFSQLALASILTIHFVFLVVCIGFAVSVTWALLLLRLRMALAEAEQAAPVAVPRFVGLTYVAYVTSMTAALLMGAVLVFLVMPRLQIGLANRYSSTVHVSGFSEEVRLGDVGSILRRNEPVMRVEVRDRAGEPLDAPRYYHGLALDRFDGRRWKLASAAPVRLVNSRFPLDERPMPAQAQISQRFALEPMNSRVIFFVSTPVELLVPLTHIEAATTEGFFFPLDSGRPEYRVYSDVARPTPEQFRAATGDYPSDIAPHYLQLPSTSERVRQLASTWVGKGGTPYDGVLVMQQRLREDFVYSLDQPSGGADDPVDHFLFESREGHCEFYATAMAVLLRSAGVPARVVNGFHGGDYNPAGDYFIVRQRHAHSWVEVYFPGLGWQLFDPTPTASSPGDQAQLRFTALVQGWLDIAGVRWRRLVLEYDQADQFGALDRGLRQLASHDVLVPDLGLPGLELDTPDGDLARGLLPWLLAAVLLALAMAGGWTAWRTWNDPELRQVPPGPSRRFTRLTRRWLARTSVRLDLEEGATALEIARAWDGTDRDDAQILIRRYYAVRFGGALATPEDVAAARARLRERSPRVH